MSQMDVNKGTFNYTYSAKQQREIELIREKYITPQPTKLEQLRRLDRKATKKGTVVSIAIGVTVILLMGLGMYFSMVCMGALFYPGIALGLAGIALVAAAHPLFIRITKSERKKIAPEILRLTDELSKE